MKVEIEVDDDTIDEIVVERLRESLDSVICDIESREDGLIPNGVFCSDKKKDLRRLRKLARSFKKVLGWYSQWD